MGIARLLDEQQPDNTHGIYRFGPHANAGAANFFLCWLSPPFVRKSSSFSFTPGTSVHLCVAKSNLTWLS
jgi:hypothetical protein